MHPIHDLPDVCGDCGSPWPLCQCPPTPIGAALCVCDFNPAMMDGPSIDCPVHGLVTVESFTPPSPPRIGRDNPQQDAADYEDTIRSVRRYGE